MSAARILPREEWHRLPEDVAAFFATMNPEDVAAVVVQEGERIVARMAVIRVPHFECFAIEPDKAGNAGVTRALLRAATEKAREWAGQWIYANADSEATCETVERLGGRFLPMHTYWMPLEGSCHRR